MSWNKSTGAFEPKPIINWIKERVENQQEVWRHLKFKVEGERKSVVLTHEHEVYTDRGIVRLDELTQQDTLYYCKPKITLDGISAVIGSYLGDGSITKQGWYWTGHSSKQIKYVEHLAAKFGGVRTHEAVVNLKWTQKATGLLISRDHDVVRIRVLLHNFWKNCPLTPKKEITEWMLDNLNPVAIAYWYMDDGCLQHYKKTNRFVPTFCCESFTMEDCHRLAERLLVEWGIDSWVSVERVNQGVEYGRIFVKKESVARFFELVAPYMVPTFDYKIPPAYQNIPKKDIDFIRYERVPITDFKVFGLQKDRAKLGWKYDVTVADNHNVVIKGTRPEGVKGSQTYGVGQGLSCLQCAKNSFRSEVVKTLQYRKRMHVTGDNLEKFYGFEDHEVDRHDAEKQLRAKFAEITCRWGDPQEIGAIRYLIECVVSDDQHNKQAAIRAAAFAWGISLEMAKFFYTWTLVALRDELYAQTYVPFTSQELFMQHYSYTNLPDLLNVITWEQMRKLIAVHGGSRFKIPTVAQIAQVKEDYDTHREIDLSDKDPETVAEIAKKRKRTPRTAQEAYETMIETLSPKRSGEHFVYDGNSHDD